eukprot:SAG31_NODE_2095_length_6455_cov_10.774072_2_plen_1371_part_00
MEPAPRAELAERFVQVEATGAAVPVVDLLDRNRAHAPGTEGEVVHELAPEPKVPAPEPTARPEPMTWPAPQSEPAGADTQGSVAAPLSQVPASQELPPRSDLPLATNQLLNNIQKQQEHLQSLQETMSFAAAEQSAQQQQLLSDQLSWFKSQQNYQEEFAKASMRFLEIEQKFLSRLETVQAPPTHTTSMEPTGGIGQATTDTRAATDVDTVKPGTGDAAQSAPRAQYGGRAVDKATFEIIDRIQRQADSALASSSTVSASATERARTHTIPDHSDHYSSARAAMRAISASADRTREEALSVAAGNSVPAVQEIDIMMPPSCWPVGRAHNASDGFTDLDLDVSRRISAVANGTNPAPVTAGLTPNKTSPAGTSASVSPETANAAPPNTMHGAKYKLTDSVTMESQRYNSTTVTVRQTNNIVTELGRDPTGPPKIGIVHLCNTEADWTAGFAKASLDSGDLRWAMAKERDEARVRMALAANVRNESAIQANHERKPAWARKGERLMGQCSIAEVSENLVIGNLYAQLTRLDKASLHSLNDALTLFIRQNRPKQIHTYKLGCVLLAHSGDKLDWATEVYPMMERLAQRYKCSFIVWENTKRAKTKKYTARGPVVAEPVERIQITPLGRSTVRPGPQTFGRLPAQRERQQTRKKSQRRDTAQQQSSSRTLSQKNRSSRNTKHVPLDKETACLHIKPQRIPGTTIVDDGISAAQVAHFGSSSHTHREKSPADIASAVDAQTAVSNNVRSAISETVAHNIRTALQVNEVQGFDEGKLEDLATTIIRKEVAKLLHGETPNDVNESSRRADITPTIGKPNMLVQPARTTDDDVHDDGENYDFDWKMRNLVLAVVGQNPANLQGLSPALFTSDRPDNDGFPNEPYGPCAVTTGAAGRWTCGWRVKPPLSLPRKQRIPQNIIDAAKKLRYKVRLRWASAAFDRLREHQHLRASMKKVFRQWRSGWKLARQHRQNVENTVIQAVQRLRNMVVSKAFAQWQIQSEAARQHREQMLKKVVQSLLNFALSNAFDRWHTTYCEVKTARRAWDIVFAMFREKLRCYWGLWKQNVQQKSLGAMRVAMEHRNCIMLTSCLQRWSEVALLSMTEKNLAELLGSVKALAAAKVEQQPAEPQPAEPSKPQPSEPISQDININVNWAELLQHESLHPRMSTGEISQHAAWPPVSPARGLKQTSAAAAEMDDSGYTHIRYMPSNAAELQSDSDHNPRQRRYRSNARVLQSDSDYSEEEYDGAGVRVNRHPYPRQYRDRKGMPPTHVFGTHSRLDGRFPWNPVDSDFFSDARVKNRAAVRAHLSEQRELSGDEGSIPSTEWGSEQDWAFISSTPNVDIAEYNFDPKVDSDGNKLANGELWGETSDLSEGEIPQ